MGALTRETPKPLLEVAGVSLLERVLSGLVDAGIERAVVVTGYLAAEVETAATRMRAPTLRFVRQAEPHGTAHAIGLARPLLADAAFFRWLDAQPSQKSAIFPGIAAMRFIDAQIPDRVRLDICARIVQTVRDNMFSDYTVAPGTRNLPAHNGNAADSSNRKRKRH